MLIQSLTPTAICSCLSIFIPLTIQHRGQRGDVTSIHEGFTLGMQNLNFSKVCWCFSNRTKIYLPDTNSEPLNQSFRQSNVFCALAIGRQYRLRVLGKDSRPSQIKAIGPNSTGSLNTKTQSVRQNEFEKVFIYLCIFICQKNNATTLYQ